MARGTRRGTNLVSKVTAYVGGLGMLRAPRWQAQKAAKALHRAKAASQERGRQARLRSGWRGD